MVSKFKNSVLVQKSIKSAIQSTFIFFQIELWVRYFFVFRSSSELVSKFKNSVLVQKSINSAIQALLIFFRLSYGLTSTFFSNRPQSWFLNSKILFVFGNRSRARSKDYFFFRSSSGLVFKLKNSILVQKSINSAIQRLLIFFRLSSGFVIFLFSDRAQSWFLNSKILF